MLCPQCTNKRLDICELKICDDMRALIRERLGAGDEPGEIVRFFATRYGDRVLADLPRSGFNLLLFGWVAGAMALALLGGGTMLIRMRRASTPAAGDPLGDAEERWIDRQVSGDGERR